MNITTQNDTTTIHIDMFDSESYQTFLQVKSLPRYDVKANHRGYVCSFPAEYAPQLGIEQTAQQQPLPYTIPDFLFDRQQVGVKVGWAKKRYAFFYDAGLGKTLLFAELARQIASLALGKANTGKKVLIVSPLNVIDQTIEEVFNFYPDYPHIINLHVRHSKSQPLSTLREFVKSEYRIAIVNHEWFRHSRNLKGIDCIILDESSILKSSHGQTSTHLIRNSQGIPYKYCFSATPAPNDRREYARHALFLELVRSENEFLSRFFVTKDQGWVLRKHGAKKFYQYLASWSIFMRHPEAYGLEAVHLPPYQEIQVKVEMTKEQIDLINKTLGNEQLSLAGLPAKPRNWHERQAYNQISKGFYYTDRAKKHTVFVKSNKPAKIREIISSHPGEQVIIWTVYDEEGEIAQQALANTGLKVVQITGSTPQSKRTSLIADFRHGKTDVLITKPRLLGLGLNLHMATVQIWSGLADSYEKFYQGVKRSVRYPQDKTVSVYLLYTEHEKAILDNVLAKRDVAEADYAQQERLYTASLYDEIQEYLSGDFVSLREDTKKMVYDPVITDDYQLYHTDSIKATLDGLAENSVDLAVFSPPFPADIFAYTDSTSDMGNTGGKGIEGNDEYLAHLEFCLTGVYNTLKKGRICAIEIQQSPRRKELDGCIGMYDSRGDIIRIAEKVGFYQVGEWPVLGNPQAEAIVKHISTLSMNYIREDRAKLAPMILDYILIFRKPGENETPITNQIVYVSIDKLAECDTNAGGSVVHLEREWRDYQKEPARHEWPFMLIDGQFNNRVPGSAKMLVEMKKANADIPDFVKVENEEWLVPVEIAWVTNENWIEYADGIAQEQEFNRFNSQYNAMKQGQRVDSYLEKVKQQYAHAKNFILDMDRKLQNGEITENELISAMTGAFVDIDQTQTLNSPYAKGRTTEAESADKHICPFSIPLVNRLIRMYSNPGETILDPFGGIGTVPSESLKLGRKAIALELKPEYFIEMVSFVEQVANKPKQLSLF